MRSGSSESIRQSGRVSNLPNESPDHDTGFSLSSFAAQSALWMMSVRFLAHLEQVKILLLRLWIVPHKRHYAKPLVMRSGRLCAGLQAG
jgi:hypothetical protein